MLFSIHLKDVASYSKNNAEVLEGLKKINFIYGSNGSGKTTISNFLSGKDSGKFQSCKADWAHSAPLKTLVYNKQFRDENFGDGEIAGVFTLGKATKDEIQEIENKKSQLLKLELEMEKKKETLQKQNERLQDEINNYDQDRWANVYLQYKDEFKEAFTGFIGSKKSFTQRLKEVCNFEYGKEELLTIEDIREKAKTIFGKIPTHIELLTLPIFDEIVAKENDPIWQTVIVGKSDVDIAGLIMQLGANDWVDTGREYINETTTCPFCQQESITDDFRRQLDAFFDEGFKKKKVLATTAKEQYESSFATRLSSLKMLLSQEQNNSDTKLELKTMSTLLKTLESQFSENKEHLKNKLEHISNVYKLRSTKSTWNDIEKCIKNANEKITEHNRIASKLTSETKKLKENIWLYIAEESQAAHKEHEKKVNGVKNGIDSIKKDISERDIQSKNLAGEIIDLNKNVTSVQPTVDEINRLLRAFGFHNFSLVPSPDAVNHYTIKYEDGSLAHKSLSEGEITFITFLYFLQLVKGSHSEVGVSDDRIVVIDDPISSLDSNILFIVSTLIKGLIKEIKEESSRTKQLIVLTHNVYFHKEASFIDGRTTKNNQTNYWIIRKVNKHSKIQAYGMNNPVESSYELLWKEIQNWQNNSGITVQNTMRRIIENYFKILGKFGDDDLINKFDTQEERDICRSLLCWINDGSHCLPDDLFIQSPEDEIQRFLHVFKGIFEHTDNLGHYNMMIRKYEVAEPQ